MARERRASPVAPSPKMRASWTSSCQSQQSHGPVYKATCSTHSTTQFWHQSAGGNADNAEVSCGVTLSQERRTSGIDYSIPIKCLQKNPTEVLLNDRVGYSCSACTKNSSYFDSEINSPDAGSADLQSFKSCLYSPLRYGDDAHTYCMPGLARALFAAAVLVNILRVPSFQESHERSESLKSEVVDRHCHQRESGDIRCSRWSFLRCTRPLFWFVASFVGANCTIPHPNPLTQVKTQPRGKKAVTFLPQPRPLLVLDSVVQEACHTSQSSRRQTQGSARASSLIARAGAPAQQRSPASSQAVQQRTTASRHSALYGGLTPHQEIIVKCVSQPNRKLA